jgi:cell division protein FtsX
MLQGTVGAGLSLLGLWLFYLLLEEYLIGQLALFGPQMRLLFIDPASITMILVIGLLLGALGSLFSLRRFLKTWRG